MKCPLDATQMEQGFFEQAHWVSGGKPAFVSVFGWGRKTDYVIAWRCPKCGKIEFYSASIQKKS